MTKTYIDELAEEIVTLREENERLKKWMKKWVEVFNTLNIVKENKRLQIMVNNRDNAVTDLTGENQRLKSYLRECIEYIGNNFVSPKMRKTLTEIDEVLK